MVKVLSIDPGIINLAFAIIDCKKNELILDEDKESYNKDIESILYWDCINLKTFSTNSNIKCSCITSAKKRCSLNAKYYAFCKENTEELKYFCQRHSKNKEELVSLIGDDFNYFDLQLLTKKIITVLESLVVLESFKDLNYIIIEDQAAASERVKFVSHVIFGFLCNHYPYSKIRMFPAKYKLSVYQGEPFICKLKGKYSQNKWLAIKHTECIIESFDNIWKERFLSFSKRDDVSDALLSCLYFIRHNYSVYPIKNNKKTYRKNKRKWLKK